MIQRKTRRYIRKETDIPVTKKEFSRFHYAEIEKTHVSQSDLLNTKQYTKHQLDSYVKKGLVEFLKYKGQKYFPKDQLIKLLDAESTQQNKLF